MSQEINIQYLGSTIEYHEFVNQWMVMSDGECAGSYPSLEKAKARAKALVRKASEEKKTPALMSFWNGQFSFIPCLIGCEDDESRDSSREFWITATINGKKKRTKKPISELYVDNEHNKNLIAVIEENNLEVKRIEKETREAISKLTHYTP